MIRTRPRRPVIVIAQDSNRGAATLGQSGEHAGRMPEFIRLVAREIAGIGDDIRIQGADLVKHAAQIGVVHPGPNVDVAELDHSRSAKSVGQVG